MAGPGSNRSGAGSNKNTVLNAKSKAPKPGLSYTPYGSSATPAPADPNSYGAYAAQVMGLQQRLAAVNAGAKVGISGAQAQLMLAKQQAAQGLVQGVTAAESDALQRGIVGSSADLGNRAAAVTDAATARQAAQTTAAQDIAQQRVNQMTGVGEFYTGLGAAQADLANSQAMQNISRYQNDAFDVLNQNYKKLQAQWQAWLTSRGRTRTSGAAPYQGPVASSLYPTLGPGSPGIPPMSPEQFRSVYGGAGRVSRGY